MDQAHWWSNRMARSIDRAPARLTDEWGRPFYLHLKMRIYEPLASHG